MVENKWIVDGHHYTCPACKKTVAIVVNESDDGFEVCPFCGKRMSGQMPQNKMAEVAALFGKELRKPFYVKKDTEHIKVVFTEYGLTEYLRAGAGFELNSELLMDLFTGEAVIVDDK